MFCHVRNYYSFIIIINRLARYPVIWNRLGHNYYRYWSFEFNLHLPDCYIDGHRIDTRSMLNYWGARRPSRRTKETRSFIIEEPVPIIKYFYQRSVSDSERWKFNWFTNRNNGHSVVTRGQSLLAAFQGAALTDDDDVIWIVQNLFICLYRTTTETTKCGHKVNTWSVIGQHCKQWQWSIWWSVSGWPGTSRQWSVPN